MTERPTRTISNCFSSLAITFSKLRTFFLFPLYPSNYSSPKPWTCSFPFSSRLFRDRLEQGKSKRPSRTWICRNVGNQAGFADRPHLSRRARGLMPDVPTLYSITTIIPHQVLVGQLPLETSPSAMSNCPQLGSIMLNIHRHIARAWHPSSNFTTYFIYDGSTYYSVCT